MMINKQPSLMINPGKNLWHCLGACQSGGSVIDWVMREKGLDFRDAVGWLQMYVPSASQPGQPRGVAQVENNVSGS
jgi:DNA primase